LLAAVTAFDIGLAEWAIIVAAIIFAFDVLGLSRSGRTVRRQNADLRERNATLEGEVKTLEGKVANLEREVGELKRHSVDALLSEFRDHDQRMSAAATGLTENLNLLATNIARHEDQAQARHQAMMEVMKSLVRA
jgi:chromosome segregation ATPase